MKDRWSVGELARAVGVTVRTLHYYDEIGLVPAGARTPAGHRRYTGDDVRRLYRVRALHQLGFSLEEIGGLLSAPEPAALRQLLAVQLADLDDRAARIDQLRSRIQALMERAELADAAQFLAVLEATVPLLDPRAGQRPPGDRAGPALARDRR